MNGNSEGDAFKVVDEALSGLETDAQRRLLEWANSKFGGNAVAAIQKNAGTVATDKPTKNKTASATKKPKVVMKQVKDLDLRPKGKPSANDFAKEKAPSNLRQKCTVAAYYLVNVLELEVVTASHVLTFFKEVGWPVPGDLINTMQQAGSEGWLDTKNAEDVKVTLRGESVVEHQLPVKE
jgi:hypothetical protein